ncbi:hypothetical protein LTR53_011595 [Teratosphaeriaceae sp. CCFEE 6253]|nr:hypothetical protein LTR53_011595 [Teratosphaeriaceae sp. CCFEE 6253]
MCATTTDLASYDLPHRTHSAHIYPIRAPNGSTLIIYAHDRGITLVWRGGRRRKDVQSTPPRASGTSHHQGITAAVGSSAELAHQALDHQLEDEEDELDPDCPYPKIIHTVDVDLGAEVLRLAVPSLPSSLGKMSRLTEMQDYQQAFDTQRQAFANLGQYCTSLAAKAFTQGAEQSTSEPGETLVIAATVLDKLHILHLTIDTRSEASDGIKAKVVPLPCAARKVSLHPSARSTEVLLSDISGAIRVYDLAPRAINIDDSPADNSVSGQSSSESSGRWDIHFMTPFTSQSGSQCRRKQVLDAAWVLNGKAILAVLEDGEWGIWSLTGHAQAGGNPGDFVLRGSLGASIAGEPSHSAKQPKSRLAPMTPNTRKVKSETFFAGPTNVAGAAARGGISVVTSSIRAGQTDESVVLWYNNDLYTIPSLQTFWQRSTKSSSGGGLGSLYAPGLTRITDINLMNECITSVSQFAPTAASSGVGHMNTQRDLLVAAEHRLIILQALRPPGPARTLFQPAAVERPSSHDQVMLDAGRLDIGGMDRMLDSMANSDARPRKVGFAR